MAYGQGNQVRLTYIAEVTRGITPGTPSMKILRAIQRNINLVKNTLRSAEVRSTRQVKDVRHGFNRVEGQIGFELSLRSYDDMLASLLGGTWVAVTTSGTPDLGATASTNVFTRSTGSWITDGYRAGDLITAAGFSTAANNGVHRVTAVAETDLTVASTLATDAETSGPTIALTGKRLDVGTTLSTFSIERQFLDIDVYQVLKGVLPGSAEFRIQPEQIVGGVFNMLGMSASVGSGTSLDDEPDAAPTTDPFSAFEGELRLGSTPSVRAACTGTNFNLNNNRNLSPVVFSQFSPDVFDGTMNTTGQLSAFTEDLDFYDAFFNEETAALWIKMDDPDGTNFMNFVFPRIKYTGHAIDPAQEGPVIQNMPWEALEPTTGTCVSIQRSND